MRGCSTWRWSVTPPGRAARAIPPGFELVLPDTFAKVRERDFKGDFIAAVALGESATLSREFIARFPEMDALSFPCCP